MMGGTHAATGALAGALAGWALGSGPLVAAAGALVCAGAAMIPDLDHENACATNTFGPITRAISDGLRGLSFQVWKSTRTPADLKAAKHSPGKHRYLTHTAIFALITGVISVTAASWLWPRLVLLTLVISFGLRGFAQIGSLDKHLDNAWLRAALAGAAAWGCSSVLTPYGIAAACILGCLVHCLGDWCTRAGIPFLWPAEIRGQRWCRLRAPITISTGQSRVESVLCYVSAVSAPLITLFHR